MDRAARLSNEAYRRQPLLDNERNFTGRPFVPMCETLCPTSTFSFTWFTAPFGAHLESPACSRVRQIPALLRSEMHLFQSKRERRPLLDPSFSFISPHFS